MGGRVSWRFCRPCEDVHTYHLVNSEGGALTLSSGDLYGFASKTEGYGYVAAWTSFKISIGNLNLSTDLTNRFPYANLGAFNSYSFYNQRPDEKKVYGYAVRGFKDEQNYNSKPSTWWENFLANLQTTAYRLGATSVDPMESMAETPLTPCVMGFAEYTATHTFPSPAVVTEHRWQPQESVLKLDGSDPTLLIENKTTYQKKIHFDLGPLTLQNLYSFPKTTTLKLDVKTEHFDGVPHTLTVPGEYKIEWRPKLQIIKALEGQIEPEWDPTDEMMEDYIRRRGQVIKTGATLTGIGLDLLYVQPAQDLLLNSILHGVQSLGLIQRGLNAIEGAKPYLRKATDTSIRLVMETRGLIGVAKNKITVWVTDSAMLASVRQRLNPAIFAVRSVDELPAAMRGAEYLDDVARATASRVVRNSDDLAHVEHAGAYGSWSRLEESSTYGKTLLEQADPNSCGPTSVAMILKDLGHDVSEASMIAHIGKELTTAEDLVRALKNFDATRNWFTGWVNSNKMEGWLNNPNVPWIAMMKEYGKIAHWVIVDGKDAAGKIIIRDPSTGTMYKMLKSHFLENWDGTIVSSSSL
jgi:Peptidase C39 family